MKKILSLLLSVLMLISSVAAVSFNAFAEEGTYIDVAAEELKLINTFRTSSNAWYWNEDNITKTTCSLTELEYSDELEGFAKTRAKEIAEQYGHTRPDGTSWYTIYDGKYLSMVENISRYPNSVDEVMKTWIEEDSDYSGQIHRRNMLTDICDSVGVACYEVDGVKYWVQEFGTKMPQKPAHIHTYVKAVTPATATADGKIVEKCSCGSVKSTSVIKKVSNVKLSASAYTYDTKVKTPTLTVKDSAGKALVKNTDYTVSVPSGRKNVGKYTYKITFKGNYSGSKSLSFTINPKGTALSKLTATKGGFKATWKKQATQTTGYIIQYSTSSKFTSAKTTTVSKNGTVSASVSKLTKGKKYYVRIRTYKTVSGTKYYSAWSTAKTVTTKK